MCGETPSEEFASALKEKACIAETLKMEKRDHIDIIFKAAKKGDPLSEAILDFVAKYTKK